jgi:hypothetical protein
MFFVCERQNGHKKMQLMISYGSHPKRCGHTNMCRESFAAEVEGVLYQKISTAHLMRTTSWRNSTSFPLDLKSIGRIPAQKTASRQRNVDSKAQR